MFQLIFIIFFFIIIIILVLVYPHPSASRRTSGSLHGRLLHPFLYKGLLPLRFLLLSKILRSPIWQLKNTTFDWARIPVQEMG